MTFREFKDMIEDRQAIEKQETLADLRRLHNENGAQYGGDDEEWYARESQSYLEKLSNEEPFNG